MDHEIYWVEGGRSIADDLKGMAPDCLENIIPPEKEFPGLLT
jgi:hypothetical protein